MFDPDEYVLRILMRLVVLTSFLFSLLCTLVTPRVTRLGTVLLIFFHPFPDSFHLFDWLNVFRPDHPCKYEDNDQQMSMVESCLIFLATLVSMRTNIGQSHTTLFILLFSPHPAYDARFSSRVLKIKLYYPVETQIYLLLVVAVGNGQTPHKIVLNIFRNIIKKPLKFLNTGCKYKYFQNNQVHLKEKKILQFERGSQTVHPDIFYILLG